MVLLDYIEEGNNEQEKELVLMQRIEAIASQWTMVLHSRKILSATSPPSSSPTLLYQHQLWIFGLSCLQMIQERSNWVHSWSSTTSNTLYSNVLIRYLNTFYHVNNIDKNNSSPLAQIQKINAAQHVTGLCHVLNYLHNRYYQRQTNRTIQEQYHIEQDVLLLLQRKHAGLPCVFPPISAASLLPVITEPLPTPPEDIVVATSTSAVICDRKQTRRNEEGIPSMTTTSTEDDHGKNKNNYNIESPVTNILHQQDDHPSTPHHCSGFQLENNLVDSAVTTGSPDAVLSLSSVSVHNSSQRQLPPQT